MTPKSRLNWHKQIINIHIIIIMSIYQPIVDGNQFLRLSIPIKLFRRQ